MWAAAAELPTDVATLQAMVLAHAAELAENRAARQLLDGELASARAGLVEQRFEIEALKSRLAKLLRVAFGRSSEKLRERIEQLELALADVDELLGETDVVEQPAAAEDDTPTAEARKPARRPLPEALPREVVEHAAPCACPACGGALRPLGKNVTEVLDYVPGSFRVVRHVRPKLPAGPARRSPRRRPRACQSGAGGPAPDCWPTCWWPSTATTCRCTGRPRSTPARRSSSAARRWPTWWVRRRGWCARWSTRWRGT